MRLRIFIGGASLGPSINRSIWVGSDFHTQDQPPLRSRLLILSKSRVNNDNTLSKILPQFSLMIILIWLIVCCFYFCHVTRRDESCKIWLYIRMDVCLWLIWVFYSPTRHAHSSQSIKDSSRHAEKSCKVLMMIMKAASLVWARAVENSEEIDVLLTTAEQR